MFVSVGGRGSVVGMETVWFLFDDGESSGYVRFDGRWSQHYPDGSCFPAMWENAVEKADRFVNVRDCSCVISIVRHWRLPVSLHVMVP